MKKMLLLAVLFCQGAQAESFFGSDKPDWIADKRSPVTFRNRASCADASSRPTESIFILLDSYNAGKIADNFARLRKNDPKTVRNQAMFSFRLAVSKLSLTIINKLLKGELPLLPIVTDASSTIIRDSEYAKIIEKCSENFEQDYCSKLDRFIEKVIPNPAKKSPNIALPRFPNNESLISCHYLKMMGNWHMNMVSPYADKEAITSLAQAELKSDDFVEDCFRVTSDSRHSIVQIDLHLDQELKKIFRDQGFDFWNSFKIYLSWYWRNAPDETFSKTFANLFTNIAFEQSILMVPAGCESIEEPACDNEYLSNAQLRELFNPLNSEADIFQASPSGPHMNILVQQTPGEIKQSEENKVILVDDETHQVSLDSKIITELDMNANGLLEPVQRRVEERSLYKKEKNESGETFLTLEHKKTSVQNDDVNIERKNGVNEDTLNVFEDNRTKDVLRTFFDEYTLLGNDLNTSYEKSLDFTKTLSGAFTENELVSRLEQELSENISTAKPSQLIWNYTYYLCTENHFIADKFTGMKYEDLDVLRQLNFNKYQSDKSATNKLSQIVSYGFNLSQNVSAFCKKLSQNNFWSDPTFDIYVEGFGPAYRSEASRLGLLVGTQGKLDPYPNPKTDLFLAFGNGDKVLPICNTALDCTRKYFESLMALHRAITYGRSHLLNQRKINSFPAFNQYAERKACNVYDPWKKKRNAVNNLLIEMGNIAAFGWNYLPFFFLADVQDGQVTSFEKLIAEDKVIYSPRFDKNKLKANLLVDFGPITGVPCVISIANHNSPRVVNPGYAFEGFSISSEYGREWSSYEAKSGEGLKLISQKGFGSYFSCRMNLSVIDIGFQATNTFSPIAFGKLLAYTLGATSRYIDRISDPIDIPKQNTVNPQYAAQTYEKYDEIPDFCVGDLKGNKPCRTDPCTKNVEKFFRKNLPQTELIALKIKKLSTVSKDGFFLLSESKRSDYAVNILTNSKTKPKIEFNVMGNSNYSCSYEDIQEKMKGVLK